MANLKAGVIVPITPTSGISGNVILFDELVFNAIKNGSSVDFIIKITIPNSMIVADDAYDEEYLKEQKKAHLKFKDDSDSKIGIVVNSTSISLVQETSSDRDVSFDFKFTIDDGKVGGASLFIGSQNE